MVPPVIETEESPETGREREARKRWTRLDGPGATIGSLRPFRSETAEPPQRALEAASTVPKRGNPRTLKVRHCSYFIFVCECEVIAIGGGGGHRMCPPLALYLIYHPVYNLRCLPVW